MITREQLIRRAEIKRRIEEIKSSITDPKRLEFINSIEKSLVIKPEAPKKIAREVEPNKKSTLAEESSVALFSQPKKQKAQESTMGLNSFGLSLLKKFNIPKNFLAETLKTDSLIGAEPGTTLSQLHVESGLNPKSVSDKGALGIAQVIPSTKRAIEKRLNRKLNPFSIMDAVILHREIMRENMEMFKDLSSSFMAYNSGWNPRKWKNEETSAYVGKIEESKKKLFGSGNKNKQM